MLKTPLEGQQEGSKVSKFNFYDILIGIIFGTGRQTNGAAVWNVRSIL
jgi:hypothetical protein